MPKTYRLIRLADEPAIVEGWAIPPIGEILALPFDASGTGKVGGNAGSMELRLETAYKVVDAPNAFDGSAQSVEVVVTVRRKAVNENEQHRVDKAVAEQSKRTLASKLRKAEEATNNVQATIGAFREGQTTQAQIVAAHTPKPKSPADMAREIAETIQAGQILREALSLGGQKALTDGSN